MFEQFSSGYYLGRLYVEPYDGERAAIHATHHERVNEQLYESDECPLVMKVGPTHLAVEGAEGIPQRTLALPERALAAADIENPPTLSEVLLAKAERAKQFLQFGTDGPAGF